MIFCSAHFFSRLKKKLVGVSASVHASRQKKDKTVVHFTAPWTYLWYCKLDQDSNQTRLLSENPVVSDVELIQVSCEDKPMSAVKASP